MAKQDDGKIEYERRDEDTKSLAQRIYLLYFRRDHWYRNWMTKLTWGLPLATVLVMIPYIAGVGGAGKAFVNGSVSRAHAVFEKDCQKCHAVKFEKVRDQDCKSCHDGPVHQANATGEIRCAQCHVEHRGSYLLREAGDRNCTGCHSDIENHGRNLKLKAEKITRFAAGKHPEFSAALKKDERPLRLNHAVHMPEQSKLIRGLKLPMKCVDCHSMVGGEPQPVTFEQNCKSCHARELEFDVYQVLGPNAGPAPHSKDPGGIARFVSEKYENAVRQDPSLTQKNLGRNLDGGAPAAVWLQRAIQDSTSYLFEKEGRGCAYCHQVDVRGGLPEVNKVNAISGQYQAGKAQGPRWLDHAHFHHRAHRMVACVSCHTQAAKSTKTSEVLVPGMIGCVQCHGRSGTPIDNCSQCHYYHDKAKEQERDRKTIEELIGFLRSDAFVVWGEGR